MRVQKPKKIKRSAIEKTRTVLGEKIRESAVSVLPILVIVVILCLCIVPMRTDLLLTFLIGALLLTVGMGLFSLGAEQSMTLIGSRIGTALTKTKNLPLILGVSFLLGFAITVAEPDLQVLAGTVPHIEKTVLLAVVGAGVGLFMSLCMVRILYGIRLRWVLLVCYAIVFALAAFTDKNFLSIAFDSGGVTTGPMTVPFILALGLGVSNIRSDSGAKARQLRSRGALLHRADPRGAHSRALLPRQLRRCGAHGGVLREHDRDRLGVSRRDPGVP